MLKYVLIIQNKHTLQDHNIKRILIHSVKEHHMKHI